MSVSLLFHIITTLPTPTPAQLSAFLTPPPTLFHSHPPLFLPLIVFAASISLCINICIHTQLHTHRVAIHTELHTQNCIRRVSIHMVLIHTVLIHTVLLHSSHTYSSHTHSSHTHSSHTHCSHTHTSLHQHLHIHRGRRSAFIQTHHMLIPRVHTYAEYLLNIYTISTLRHITA